MCASLFTVLKLLRHAALLIPTERLGVLVAHLRSLSFSPFEE